MSITYRVLPVRVLSVSRLVFIRDSAILRLSSPESKLSKCHCCGTRFRNEDTHRHNHPAIRRDLAALRQGSEHRTGLESSGACGPVNILYKQLVPVTASAGRARRVSG